MTPAATSAIEEVRAVLQAHEEAVARADLDGIMRNMADDVVALAAHAPLVEGAAAVRGMYSQLLAMGRYECHHECSGAAVAAEIVVLHGVATNKLTVGSGEPSCFDNNFILTFKRGPNGRWLAWRVAFAPTGA